MRRIKSLFWQLRWWLGTVFLWFCVRALDEAARGEEIDRESSQQNPRILTPLVVKLQRLSGQRDGSGEVTSTTNQLGSDGKFTKAIYVLRSCRGPEGNAAYQVEYHRQGLFDWGENDGDRSVPNSLIEAVALREATTTQQALSISIIPRKNGAWTEWP